MHARQRSAFQKTDVPQCEISGLAGPDLTARCAPWPPESVGTKALVPVIPLRLQRASNRRRRYRRLPPPMSDRLALAHAFEDSGMPREKAEHVASAVFDALTRRGESAQACLVRLTTKGMSMSMNNTQPEPAACRPGGKGFLELGSTMRSSEPNPATTTPRAFTC